MAQPQMEDYEYLGEHHRAPAWARVMFYVLLGLIALPPLVMVVVALYQAIL